MFSFINNFFTQNDRKTDKKQAGSIGLMHISSAGQAVWHDHDFYHFCTQGYHKNYCYMCA